MKKIGLILFCTSLIVNLFAQTDQLYGYVFSETNGKGISNVKVIIDSYGIEDYTDSEGKFVFDGQFDISRLDIRFFKEGYNPLRKKSVLVNKEGALGPFDLELSNSDGLWFTVFSNSINKTMIKDAKIIVNGQEFWTDENGYKFVPITDHKYLKDKPDPISITISKEGYNDYTENLIYKIGKRSFEIALTEKVEIVLKFIVKENSDKGKLLEDVKISIDGSIYYTDENGFLKVEVERSGNLVITATKKKYNDYEMTKDNLKASETIKISLDKKLTSKKFFQKIDEGFNKAEEVDRKLQKLKKRGG